MLSVISEECLFVVLSQQRTITEVLQSAIETVRADANYNVIIDLSKVMILTSRHLSGLMILRNALDNNGKRLILCNMPFQIKCELRVAGLLKSFEVSRDKFSAIDALQISNSN